MLKGVGHEFWRRRDFNPSQNQPVRNSETGGSGLFLGTPVCIQIAERGQYGMDEVVNIVDVFFVRLMGKDPFARRCRL